MSGFEVAGVVLGVLPLAIEALKGYRTMLSWMRDADRNLKALIQDLETEQARLRVTCEVLLDGIAPLSRIDAMIEKPFGPEWNQFNDNIRVRLWTTTGRFKEHAREMKEAAEELREKLCIEADGKTKLHSPRAVIEECKRRASFSLKKKDYDSIISRIGKANSVLHELAGQNRELEPSRRRRSQDRVTQLIRGLSRSIFDALKSAAMCHCAQSHDVCLELISRKGALVPGDAEDDVAKNFNFHVALGSYESPDADTGCSKQGEKMVKHLQPTRWDSIRVQFEPKNEHTTEPPPSLSIAPTDCRSPSPGRRVRFLQILGPVSGRESTYTAETLTVESEEDMATNTPACPAAAPPPVLISGLCQVVLAWHRDRRNPATRCCGYIADPQRMFGLYPQNCCLESSSAVTLRQMLDEKHSVFQELDLLENMKVALAISTSILHLYKTPWLARVLTLDDIVFFQRNQKATYCPDSPLRPFIALKFVRTPGTAEALETPPQRKSRKPSRAMNLTILSLGAVLIQVVIGRAEPTLDMTIDLDMDLNAIIEKREAGLQFRNQVLEEVGENYMAAVEWCLGNVLGITGLDDEQFCQSFYEKVIARLENDIQQLSNHYWG